MAGGRAGCPLARAARPALSTARQPASPARPPTLPTRPTPQRSYYVSAASGKSQWADPRKVVAPGSGSTALAALLMPFLLLLGGGGAYAAYILVGPAGRGGWGIGARSLGAEQGRQGRQGRAGLLSGPLGRPLQVFQRDKLLVKTRSKRYPKRA
jgi:hypothetical protein